MTIADLSARESAVFDAVGENREGRTLIEIVDHLEAEGFPKYSEGLVWVILARLVRANLLYSTPRRVMSLDGKERTIGVYSRFGGVS